MNTVFNMVELRVGGVGDLALLETIMTEAFEPRFGEAWTRGQCLGILAMPGVWLTIAMVDGEAAGFALSRSVADEAELLLLAVRPARRRRGVGAALLRAMMTQARATGAAHVHLEVREGNEAVKLYHATGFAKVGERRNYYRGASGQTFNALTYRRDIAVEQ
ncbi:ribosomal protein S18-alanine N-acetyltransferase [Sphingomonas sp. AR_OL41]|uniref:ribosomal protein S18-alanine N-acetyltransferase n=1 Tax=Sphingomonas sp. AR_OL41 TaxID=3042729 RepID=UPI002480C59A|nr:ribosomal protein S18-alanine N-acetyltransferase [Sphingomonas sp. AR_OL41]MDH7972000.1 ribosomal protein S18-alanine N-acetyltransferase [Sphingomonas sp. AR_OL41]